MSPSQNEWGRMLFLPHMLSSPERVLFIVFFTTHLLPHSPQPLVLTAGGILSWNEVWCKKYALLQISELKHLVFIVLLLQMLPSSGRGLFSVGIFVSCLLPVPPPQHRDILQDWSSSSSNSMVLLWSSLAGQADFLFLHLLYFNSDLWCLCLLLLWLCNRNLFT